MNKLLTKIASLFFGMGLAIGVGAAIGSGQQALQAKADIEYDETITFSSLYSSNTVVDGKTIQGELFSVLFNKRNGGTATQYYTNGSSVRWYGGGTLVVSSSDKIEAININYTRTDNTISSDIGTWNSPNWSGEANSITFTESGTSGHLRVASISVKLAAQEEKTLSSITLSGDYPTEFNYGSAFSHEGMTVTANYSDSSQKDVTNKATFTGYNMSSAGEQTVTVSYTEGEVTKTAEYGITVLAPVAVQSVELDREELQLEAGNSQQLIAAITPGNASNKNVSWSSNNETVATVVDGLVTAVAEGNATITVTTEDGGKTDTCIVAVSEPTGATFTYGTDLSSTETLSKSGVTLALASTSDGTFASNNNNAYKVYKGKTLTVSAAKDIDRVEFTCTASGTSQYGPGCFKADKGDYAYSGQVGTWTGLATSIVFTADSNQVRMTEVRVHFKATKPTVTLDKENIDLKTNNAQGVTVKATVENVEEPTYSWTTEATNITLENATTDTVTIKPNTSVAGVAVVNLTVGGVTPALTAHVDVTISIPGPGETPETAYTVEQARAALVAGTGITNVYAKGIVCTAGTVNNGAISYYISDDGKTTSPQLEAYKGKGINGAEFENDSDIQVGDEVVIFGTLTIYQQTTYEFTSGNFLISLNRLSITLTPDEVLLDENEDGNIVDLFTNIEITQRSFDNYTVNDIEWASSDEDVLLVDEGTYIAGDAGSATLTASLGGKECAQVSVTVRKAEDPLTAITITNVPNKELDILRNDTFQLAWELTPTHPTDGEGVVFAVVDADAGSEISVTQEGLISAGSVPGVTAMISITSDHNEDIYDIVSVTVTLEEMYITVGESVFEKVTSAEELTDGDYLIVNEENEVAFNGGLDPLDAVGNKLGVVIEDGVIDRTDELLNATFTYNKTDKTLKSKSGFYMGRTSNSNGMDTNTSTKYTNTITFEENGDANIKGSGGAYLRYNNASNQIRFRYYKSDSYSGQKAVQLYKLSASDKILVGADLYNAVVAFNKEFKCDASGETFDQEAWELASVAFDNIDLTAYKLKDANANEDGNLVEQFLARYDYVVGKYGPNGLKVEGVEDFLERDPAPVPSSSYMPLGSNAKSNAAATVIIIIAVLGVTAFGVYFLLRKRKEER